MMFQIIVISSKIMLQFLNKSTVIKFFNNK